MELKEREEVDMEGTPQCMWYCPNRRMTKKT